MKLDADKLLRRKLYLQRYVTSVFNDIGQINRQSDKDLLLVLSEFVLDADDRALQSLANQRRTSPEAVAVMTGIRNAVKDQRENVNGLLAEELPALIEREAEITASAIGEEKPSMFGVLSLPVAGLAVSQIINAAYGSYSRRLISDVTTLAATNPGQLVRAVRGRSREGFKDGLLYWRNERLIRPNIDLIINGTAANSSRHVYQAYSVDRLDFVATLDFRTCPRCYSAERGSPYDRERVPPVPMHPRCRCVHMPHIEGSERVERPFVEDDRSVKEIPKSERGGRIGQTKDTIEQFFNRMTAQERRDYMGKTRALLWEQGKITDIRELVDNRTLRPLRLDELPTL